MKIENPDIISRLVNKSNPFETFRKIIGHPFPMAIWRLPQTDSCHGIIDLRPELTQSDKALEEMEMGFLINAFQDHHPCKPDFIKSDLLIEWDENETISIRQNPALTDHQLEDFFQTVQKPKHLDLFQAATSPPDFQTIVSEAIDVIHHHDIDKVVLSRYSDTQLPRDFDPFVSFNDACKTYPNAFVYILYKPDHGLWLGATPETLLSIEDSRIFKTVSLAGTQRLDENQSLSSVAWTQKEIEEQAMVSRYIIDCFKKIRLREFDENGPKTVKAGNLAHLKTEYRVDLNDVNMPNLGSVMLDLLHPTSAVCGMPLHPALQFIRDRENYDRELYSGFLGPVNIKGLTHLFVNLRCMKITNDTGRFYAGAGITGDSDPEREFIETELKMQTLKRIIFP